MRNWIGLGCCLLLTGLAACGTTGTAAPTSPGADASAAVPEPTGSSDTGSRFAALARPIGGIAVETPPMDVTVPVAAPTPADVPAPATAAPGTFPAPEPLAEDGRSQQPAPAPRWTTPRDR